MLLQNSVKIQRQKRNEISVFSLRRSDDACHFRNRFFGRDSSLDELREQHLQGAREVDLFNQRSRTLLGRRHPHRTATARRKLGETWPKVSLVLQRVEVNIMFLQINC